MSKGTSALLSARWGCDRCPSRGEARNSLAVAAQHAKRHNHPTWAEQTQRTTFGAPAGKGAAKQEKLL